MKLKILEENTEGKPTEQRMRKLISLLIFGAIMCAHVSVEAQVYLWRYQTHATDCTALTGPKERDLCYEQDDGTIYKYHSAAWHLVGGPYTLDDVCGLGATTDEDVTLANVISAAVKIITDTVLDNVFPLLVVQSGVTPENSVITPASIHSKAISIQGDGAAYFMGRDVTGDIEFIMGTSSQGATFVGTMTAHDLHFRTLNANKMVIIHSTGNVGIGTDTPAHKLDVNGAIYSRRNALTDGATIAVDWNDGNVQSVTLGDDRTFTFANGQDGGKYTLIIKQDGSGSRTVTWPGTARWADAAAPTLTTTADKTDYIGFIYNGVDSKYDGVAMRLNF